MSRYFCGIDPGVHGALAVIDTCSKVECLVSLPSASVSKSDGGKKTVIVFSALAELVESLKQFSPLDVMIEAVSSMPRDGVKTAFALGGAFWAMQQALASARIGYTVVMPVIWQKSTVPGCPKDRKARLSAYRAVAQQMFPSTDLSKVKDTDKAAALLIAAHCRQQHMGAQRG